MAERNKKSTKKRRKNTSSKSKKSNAPFIRLSHRMKNAIGAIGSFLLAIIITLSAFGLAGPFGEGFKDVLIMPFVGYGFVLLILTFLGAMMMFLLDTFKKASWKAWLTFIGTYVIVLGFLEVVFFGASGNYGGIFGSLAKGLIGVLDIYLTSAIYTLGLFAILAVIILFWDWRYIAGERIGAKLNRGIFGNENGLWIAMKERDERIHQEREEERLRAEFADDTAENADDEDAQWFKELSQEIEEFFATATKTGELDEAEFEAMYARIEEVYFHDDALKQQLLDEMDERFTAIESGGEMPAQKETASKKGSTKSDDADDDAEMIPETRNLPSTYTPPPLSLLAQVRGKAVVGDIKANALLIKRTLQNFGIDVEMDEISVGPTVTRYALKPAEGVKLSRIVGLQNDLALALAAHPLRIEAPIPGKALVGIEMPNKTKAMVGLSSMLAEPEFKDSPKPLMVCLGKGVTGKSFYANLAKMPHLLIAGATGAGKSVTVHNIIVSLLYRNGPKDLRFIMVDPKRVELTLYNKIPHLLTPVIKQPKKAIIALKWAVKEMDRRYDVLESESVRDIDSYHKTIVEPAYAKAKDGGDEHDASLPERMPYIVIIIDELSDLMQAYPRELESAIVRLAQMSRAVGIHLILSTQRPSVNVITGLIKANVPARIALQVSSQIDSRTILDTSGAEKLIGQGDMLYSGGEVKKPMRMQCAFISEEEVKKIADYLINKNEDLVDEISLAEDEGADSNVFSMSMDDDDDGDELYEDARDIVIKAGKGSTSYLQRKLKVGYSRAARLMDMLEEDGIVGPANGSKPREIVDGAKERIEREKLGDAYTPDDDAVETADEYDDYEDDADYDDDEV